jgi:tetratricopeptide (TPR) repeat protein
LTNGREFRVYKTWEAGSELEKRLLLASSLEKLSETFYQGKGLWNILSKDNVIEQSELIDKWKESQSKLPMMASYINGLLDDVSLRRDKKELLIEAFQFLETYRYSKSIELFRRCLSLGDITDSEKLALHIQIGVCFYEQGKLIESHGAFNEGLEIAKSVNDKYGMSVCLSNIGLIYSDRGDLDNALKYYQAAIKIDQEIGYKQGEASGLGNIGLVYSRARGDLDNALKYHQEALKIDQEIGYKRGEASDLSNIGLIYRAKGYPDDALKYHREALKIYEEIGYKQGAANDLGNIGLVYSARGDLDNALKCHKAALRIDAEIGYKQGEASDLSNIGLIYRDKGYLDSALKYHKAALKIFKEMGHREGEAISLSNIGLIYSAKGYLDNALKYHTEALKIDREVGYREGEANDLGNIGLIYKAKGYLDNALKYHQEALKIFNIATPQLAIQTLINIATIYFEKEFSEKGFEYLAKAISLSPSGQFNIAFSALMKTIRNMMVNNDWEKLESIGSIYTSGIITEEDFVNFIKAIHEYTLYKQTSKKTNKKIFEEIKHKLGPVLRKTLDELIEVR